MPTEALDNQLPAGAPCETSGKSFPWQVAFRLPLELVEYPRAVCVLGANERVVIALPPPGLRTDAVDLEERRSKPGRRRLLRRNVVGLATGLAFAVVSNSFVNAASAASASTQAAQNGAGAAALPTTGSGTGAASGTPSAGGSPACTSSPTNTTAVPTTLPTTVTTTTASQTPTNGPAQPAAGPGTTNCSAGTKTTPLTASTNPKASTPVSDSGASTPRRTTKAAPTVHNPAGSTGSRSSRHHSRAGGDSKPSAGCASTAGAVGIATTATTATTGRQAPRPKTATCVLPHKTRNMKLRTDARGRPATPALGQSGGVGVTPVTRARRSRSRPPKTLNQTQVDIKPRRVPQAAASAVPGPGSPWTAGFGIDPFTAAEIQRFSTVTASLDQPPAFLIPIYQAAGREFRIPWQILAAINAVETNYGQDLAVSPKGAFGWMQFMPATWIEYGVDPAGQGRPNPYDPRDAIFAAARLLAANGGTRHIRRALFAYNHALWYVDAVLWRAGLIAGRGLHVHLGKNGYALPLDARYMAQLGRTDDGVDIEDAPDGAAIYSITPGIVTAVASDPTGFGPDYPVILATAGPLAGQHIYYGHVAATLVTVGQHVVAGQPIAVMGHTGDAASLGHGHIEIGFSDGSGDPLNQHGGPAWTPSGAAMRTVLEALSRAFGSTNS